MVLTGKYGRLLMSNPTKDYDFIIFGVSGVVGYETLSKAAHAFRNYRWAVAGRNKIKITDTLVTVGIQLNKNLKAIPIIIADITDEESVYKMARTAKVLINCCAPVHSMYAESLVKACIANKTHYIDLNFDTVFIRRIYHIYEKAAEANGIYVIHNCGFLGFSKEIFINLLQESFNGTVHHIECSSRFHFENHSEMSSAILTKSLWSAILISMNNFTNSFCVPLKFCFHDIRGLLLNGFKYGLKTFKEPRKIQIQCPIMDQAVFPLGSSLSQDNQPKFTHLITLSSIFSTIKLVFWMFLTLIFAAIPGLKHLLTKFPQCFSMNYASKKSVLQNSAENFMIGMSFEVFGSSKANGHSKTLKANFHAYNPFYGFTSGALVSSAMTVMEETPNLPNKGGVFTPGVAFKKTSIIKRLEKFDRLYSFEISEESNGLRKILYLA